MTSQRKPAVDLKEHAELTPRKATRTDHLTTSANFPNDGLKSFAAAGLRRGGFNVVGNQYFPLGIIAMMFFYVGKLALKTILVSLISLVSFDGRNRVWLRLRLCDAAHWWKFILGLF